MPDDHGRRLDRHEADIEALRKGQEVIGGKLDTVLSALTEMRAQRGPGWTAILQSMQALLTIMTIAVGGIVYFASNGLSKDKHEADVKQVKADIAIENLQKDVRRIDEALSWRPSIARSN